MKVTYGAIVQRASGRFGGTVHSNWKGVDVVRRFAKPTNPNSTDQQIVRNTFRQLTALYGLMPTYTKESWTSFANGKPFIARNKVIALNVPALQGQSDYASLIPTPGDSSTLPPTAFTRTGGSGQITTSITIPTLPSGWTVSRAVACAISASPDPNTSSYTLENLRIYEAADATNPYAPTISGLPAGSYFTWAFAIYEAPDGNDRYSAAISGGAAVVVS